MQTLELECIYKGGPADDGRLGLYDGASSLEGLSRAIAITTHAFINGKVSSRTIAAVFYPISATGDAGAG